MDSPKFRMGDRFKFRTSPSIVEVIRIDEGRYGFEYDILMLSAKEALPNILEITLTNSTLLIYLGNFSKTDRFTELYDILNS